MFLLCPRGLANFVGPEIRMKILGSIWAIVAYPTARSLWACLSIETPIDLDNKTDLFFVVTVV
jgi:hypothetical protein